MPMLLETQRAFGDALRGRGAARGGILGARGISADDAIAIYRNTFVSGAVRALRLSCPAVEKLTGADFFARVAEDFVLAAPPVSGCLDDYGADFVGFLARHEALRDLPYIADVARLERAVNLALHADDVTGLDAEAFSAALAIAPSRLVLTPHPSLSLLKLDYPADAIWRAVLAGDDAAMASVVLHGGPVHLMVVRESAGVQVNRLSGDGFTFLSALCSGRSFADSFEAAPAAELPGLLADCFAKAIFTAFLEMEP